MTVPEHPDSPRVLVVAPLYHTDRGGLGRQAVLLTEKLASLGARPVVATRLMHGLPERAWSPLVEIVRVKAPQSAVHNYEAPSFRNLVTSLAFSLGTAWVLFRKRRSLDLVHVHGASLPVLVLLPFAKLLGKPLLAKVAAVNQGVEAGDVRRRYGPLGRVLAWKFASVDGYIATTAEIESVLERDGVERARTHRVPNFVDVESWKPAGDEARKVLRRELGFEGRTVVVASGRLAPRKGGDVLLRAFAKARAQALESAPLLVFLGDGPERARLESLARELSVADAVRFQGFVEDVPRWLQAADALVLASRIEGFPNALLEALSTGLACVATRIGGALEAIDDERTGLLVPADDEEALALALGRVLREPELRAKLGQAAAATVRERFALEAVAPRYLPLYRELVARAHPSETAKRKRPLRRKLLAFAISTLVALLGVEVVARFVTTDPLRDGKTVFPNASLGANAFYESLRFPSENDRWSSPYRVDPELGFSLEPGVAIVMSLSEARGGGYDVRTNALGLRDDRALEGKAQGTFRVLALGDSMTFGIGVEREEAFPAILERALAKRLAPRPVEVVNAGVPCWGQWEEIAFLEHRARALEPDFVLLQFTVANDVLDDARYREVDGKRVPDDTLARDLADNRMFTNPLATWSRAYRRFVWNYGRHSVRYEAMLSPDRLARASDLVRRARDLSTKLGAGFALVIAPPSFQVDEGKAEKVVGSKRIDDAIVERAHADGIAVLDLGEALRAAKTAGQTSYFPTDMHWNAAGHEVVGEALGAWLPVKPEK